MPSVHTIAHDIVQRQFDRPYSTVNTTLTLTEFRTLYGVYRGTPLTDPDLWLILRYINVNHGVAVDVDVPGYGRSHVAIKFPKHNEHAAFTLADINKSDRAIISLKTTCKALHDQVDELQSKMESLIKQSLDHSNKQQKPQALYALKRKHQLEQVLNRRLKSLETMETLLLKIDASHSDIQIIQAFNMGVDTLKAIFNNNQLTVTSVDETMWRMQATLEEQEQMENMITNGMDTFSENKDQQPTKDLSCPPKRTRDDDLDPIKTVPDSELARLHSILSTIPHAPSTDPPKSKQRRIRQLA
ncbi:hypothetical protein BC941DRAFT_351604 [Chlamydoabsidia padenii]|nr:hypothetical protein BC941DRAFT_351604 [Chlamydoabsidia padenii]